jgi:hypothetical protein
MDRAESSTAKLGTRGEENAMQFARGRLGIMLLALALAGGCPSATERAALDASDASTTAANPDRSGSSATAGAEDVTSETATTESTPPSYDWGALAQTPSGSGGSGGAGGGSGGSQGAGGGGSSGEGAGGGTSGSSGNGGNSPTPGRLATGIETAVDAVVPQIEAAAAALGVLTALADARCTLAPNSQDEYGVCPTTRWAASAENALVAVDYGAGCRSAATAQEFFVGNLAMVVPRSTYEAELEYVAFRVDGRTVTGHFVVQLTAFGGGVATAGDCEINTSGLGTTSGQFGLSAAAPGGTFQLAGSLDLGGYGSDVAVSVNPVGHENFIPQGGTLAFSAVDGGASHAVVVTFTAGSPVTGVVLVSVDGGAAVEYQAPL